MPGVAHCFTGSREELELCLELGLHIGEAHTCLLAEWRALVGGDVWQPHNVAAYVWIAA